MHTRTITKAMKMVVAAKPERARPERDGENWKEEHC